MIKIGIMGGTFNPIHVSHVMLGAQAKNLFGLDKVLFMPSKNPPHKDGSGLISDLDRANMVKLAIEGNEGLEFSDFEYKREGLTYTSDTLDLLTRENPDVKYYFIIGGDSIAYFDKWHLPAEILSKSALLVTQRADMSREETFSQIKRIRDLFSYTNEDGSLYIPEIHYLTAPAMDLSSSAIRCAVACGIPISGMVSKNVEEYILSHSLYKIDKIEHAKEELQKVLSPHRYIHSLSVADFAAKLAIAHGYDVVKAYTAGILHDSAKYLTDEEILSEARRFGIVPDEIELAHPNNLLHGKIAAYYTKEKYGIDDEEIFGAIYYHTSNKPEMNTLEKIIALADMLEYGRTMHFKPSLDIIRSVASEDMDLALLYIYNNNVPYLLRTYSNQVCRLTIDAWDYYKKLIESRSK
ncbi:MAG: nicotinate-nucleotide adenylyltransferase [Lachnospiraceae bacterium]|nr:nicotinate-nucleotide adenylyltransferase [Lachnospiraceae bacterium]